MRLWFLLAPILALALSASARAGLYYSGETYAELPSQWRGFLLDHRMLATIASNSKGSAAAVRKRYQDESAKLETKSRTGKLTTTELADLGALYIRLGEPVKAVALLRTAQREYPNHFAILANLGTACQLQGDLSQAAEFLQQGLRLAPGKYQQAEEYHLRLVRLRLKEGRNATGLDDLFHVTFADGKGNYQPGKLTGADKMPARATAIVQQLSLWLPQDGRLLWQLAELANATGDVKTAAAIMDGCVTQYGNQDPVLRRHRLITRAAADRLAKIEASGTTHTKSSQGLKARSQRPLVAHLDQAALPSISPTGINTLPWDVLNQTTVDSKFRPSFAKYLRALDGKQVSLTGYMQPLGEDSDLASFMFIEYPVGCWFCEMPEVSGIVYAELPAGTTIPYRRSMVRVIGRLHLNSTDPEEFLYTIRQARITEID